MHCRDFAADGQAYNKMLNVLKHYSFIAQSSTNAANPFNRSGEWAITEVGFEFINNRLRVPAYFWGVNDTVAWWALQLVTAREMEQSSREISLRTAVEDMMRASPQNGEHTGAQLCECCFAFRIRGEMIHSGIRLLEVHSPSGDTRCRI